MQPYVIKQGDYLDKLAYQFGFDATTVWNDPTNAPLRQLRPNPNILYPTDVLYIPDQVGKAAATENLTTGTTNAFQTDPPTTTVTLRFLDAACASQAFTVQEVPTLTGLTTDANGSVSFAVPVSLETFTVEFTSAGSTYSLQLGQIDPIDSLSGIFQRLQNLGYIDMDAALDPSNLEPVRAALQAFNASQPGAAAAAADSSPPPSAPESSPGSGPASGNDSSPPSSAGSWAPACVVPDPGTSPSASDSSPPSAPGSGPASGASPGGSDPPPASGPASAPASTPPPSSGPTSSPSSGASPQDDAGLSDDGKLDDATSQLLVQVHGS